MAASDYFHCDECLHDQCAGKPGPHPGYKALYDGSDDGGNMREGCRIICAKHMAAREARHLETIRVLRSAIKANEGKPIAWVVTEDRQSISAEVAGTFMKGEHGTNRLRLVTSAGVQLADIVVSPHIGEDGEPMTPQAALEEIGCALMWSHQRSLHLEETAEAIAASDYVDET